MRDRAVFTGSLFLASLCAFSCVETYHSLTNTAKKLGVTPTSGKVSTVPPPVSTFKYPATTRKLVVNEYHGISATDDYEWLEDASNPDVKAWIETQNKWTRAYFDGIPERAAVRTRIQGIVSGMTGNVYALQKAGKKWFAMRFQPPKQQHFLVSFDSQEIEGKFRVLVDPNVIDPSGKTTIDWYEVSPDGKLLAVSMSKSGTENGSVHVWETGSGKKFPDIVDFASSGTAGASLSWASDSKGFYYTRHPHTGERPAEDMGFYQQAYFHKIGTKNADDRYEIGKDFPKIAEIVLDTSPNGKWVLASVQNGDGGEYWQYLRDEKGIWTRFADIPDKVVAAKFGPDNKIYVQSTKNAPRGQILRFSPEKPELARAEILVAQNENVIQHFKVSPSRLFVVELAGGPSVLRIYDLQGKSLGLVPTLPVSAVYQIVRADGDDLLFQNVSYVEKVAWYSYSAKDGTVSKTKLGSTSPIVFDDIEVAREMCTSKDGTKVPLNILKKKGTPLDGNNPTILTGYGGYGLSLSPGTGGMNRVWFDQGGVLAIANLRGGGEFGEAWHLGGNLLNKQNVFDDFYACAKYLVETKHTRPSRLAIRGGSNGGLLMGAALTQHPEMYRAVVSEVGMYDMLRVELSPNGAFNVTEFGTVKDPAQFKALYAYSPFHHVQDKVAYPAVFLTTGANDPRVDPFHSRKMAARLQAATTGGIVMLSAHDNTGHGGGTPLDTMIDELTDEHVFLFKELGITFNSGK